MQQGRGKTWSLWKRGARALALHPWRLGEICNRTFRILTARWRPLPRFVIAGAQKCGTTSLYNYLVQHPRVLPAETKEVSYFDFNYEKGVVWYRSHFPLWRDSEPAGLRRADAPMTGEASPNYMYHPHAMQRMAETLPDALVLILLRNPVERAFSSYRHTVRRGLERCSFEEAVALESERVESEEARMMADPTYNSFNHLYFSYLRRGIYVHQVRRILELFPERNVLVLQSEKLFSRPRETYDEVLEFLGLEPYDPGTFRAYNRYQYDSMPGRVRNRLRQFYGPYNEELYELIRKRFDWA